MFEKTYIRKPRTLKAIQYDGTYDMMLDLLNEYRNIETEDSYFYFSGDYDKEEICEGDWLVIGKDNTIIEVIDRDDFADDYEIQRSQK